MRSDDSYSREPGPANNGRSDPLAELARLIGQNDPFADLARQGGRPAAQPPAAQPPAAQPPAPSRTAPEWLARTGGRQAEPAPASDDQQPSQGRPTRPTTMIPTTSGTPAMRRRPRTAIRAPTPTTGRTTPAVTTRTPTTRKGSCRPSETYDGGSPRRRSAVACRTVAALRWRWRWSGPAVLWVTGRGPALRGTVAEPPVIKAEQTPTKVVPAATSDR